MADRPRRASRTDRPRTSGTRCCSLSTGAPALRCGNTNITICGLGRSGKTCAISLAACWVKSCRSAVPRATGRSSPRRCGDGSRATRRCADAGRRWSPCPGRPAGRRLPCWLHKRSGQDHSGDDQRSNPGSHRHLQGRPGGRGDRAGARRGRNRSEGDIEVDDHRIAGGHEDGIERACLAFGQPGADLPGATGDGLAEHVLAPGHR